jgi:prepilin-type N-terminal cleavage/methylation domain-containing protein
MKETVMRRKRGFTLIELLVVISIIALLMAILFPVIQRCRNQARAVVCQSNLRQWGTFFHMYTQENQGRFFPSLEGAAIWFVRGSYIRNNDPNIPPVINDTDTRKYACCPMARKVGSGQWGMTWNGVIRIEGKMGSTFEAWDMSRPEPSFRCSYGFNRALLDNMFFGISRSGRALTRYGIDVTYVKGRQNVPVFFDCSIPGYNIRNEKFSPPPFEDRLFINRHYGCINVLFMDWSVRKIGLKGLYTLKWNMEFNTAGPWTKAGGVRPEDWPQWMQGFKDY